MSRLFQGTKKLSDKKNFYQKTHKLFKNGMIIQSMDINIQK